MGFQVGELLLGIFQIDSAFLVVEFLLVVVDFAIDPLLEVLAGLEDVQDWINGGKVKAPERRDERAQAIDPSSRKRYGQEYLSTRRNCRIDPSTVRGEARLSQPCQAAELYSEPVSPNKPACPKPRDARI